MKEVRLDVIDNGGGNNLLSDIQMILNLKKPEILLAYDMVEGYDVEKEFGPIEEWFGFSSVSSYEMRCNTFFGYEGPVLIVLIKN